ncbi:hypothetical protein SRABI112_00764 [Pseudomonas mediterranea]|nr:hypothetical protein SRABI112_00764 [Pseudomonas mediterranea]
MSGESQSPRQQNILKIAKALGVSANWIWTGKQDLFPLKTPNDAESIPSAPPTPKRTAAKTGRARTKLEIKIVDGNGSKTFTSLEQEKSLAIAIQAFINDYVAEIYGEDYDLLEALRTYRLSEMKLLFVEAPNTEKT